MPGQRVQQASATAVVRGAERGNSQCGSRHGGHGSGREPDKAPGRVHLRAGRLPLFGIKQDPAVANRLATAGIGCVIGVVLIKRKQDPVSEALAGGSYRDRTDDIHGVNVALYQLS